LITNGKLPGGPALEERLRYLRELDERPRAILDSISQQGKLDAALKHAIEVAALQAA
jgi:protein Tex